VLLGQATATRRTPATRLGFSVERLARIDRAMQERVDNGTIAGAVGLVLRDGQVLYERAVGWSDKEADRRMTTEAIFRIASQSKAITTTAIMMLVEEGKVALNDPVSRFIPTYARTSVAVRSTASRRRAVRSRFRPSPTRRAFLRHQRERRRAVSGGRAGPRGGLRVVHGGQG
jgi:CubicO group peptidase (beta-lactamase class C family)